MTARRKVAQAADVQRFYTEVGWRVAMARTMRKRSQAQMATALGMSRVNFSNLENGNQRIKLEDLYEIASALNVPLKRLLPSLKHLPKERTK